MADVEAPLSITTGLPWQNSLLSPASAVTFGVKLILISLLAVIEQPVLGWAVRIKTTKPLSISPKVGEKIGVSDEALLTTPGAPTAPIGLFVQRIELASETVTKLGKVKVSAHRVISSEDDVITGFLFIENVMVLWSVLELQLPIPSAFKVKVTDVLSAEPNL